jgi:CRP-like cAMP-binding protein
MADSDLLKSLIPINALRAENFEQLLSRSRIEKLPPKETVFRLGDSDADTIYLLQGEMTLVPQKGADRVVVGGSADARYALAQLKPRQFTGVTKTAVTLARVDGALLDRLLTMDQTAGYEVEEIGAEDGEWVFRMMQHPTFEKVPPGNLAALFGRLAPIDVQPGRAVIRQGDPGDFYYIVRSGRFSVSRKSEKDGKVVVLAELGEGDGFGEEALVSGAPRNANVIALVPGTLMQLSKRDFDELLREPLVQQVSGSEAQQLAQSGTTLLDVRTEDEFARGAIKGALNVPLYALRLKAKSLDPDRKYLIYCQTGNRSAVAAFLLSQRGFNVCVLRGGLNSMARS